MHLIAVTHPHRRFLGQPFRQRIMADDRQLGTAKLPRLRRLDLPAQEIRPELHSVTNPEHRHTQIKNPRIALGRVWRVNTAWTTAQNQTFGI